jgi:hypothetical protein
MEFGFPDSGFSVFLFKIIINTIPFKIPPTFENVVTKLNSSCGTSSISCQIPYKDIGNHWTKKATTNTGLQEIYQKLTKFRTTRTSTTRDKSEAYKDYN